MRILYYEWRKLRGRRFLWVIFAVLSAVNLLMLLRSAQKQPFTRGEYRAFYHETAGLSGAAALDTIDRMLESESASYSPYLLYTLREQAEELAGYSDYLAMISAQRGSMSALFSKPDTFTYRNIEKTPDAYRAVQDVQPVFAPSEGIICALQSDNTVIFTAFFVILLTVCILLRDREIGIISLLYPLKSGRARLYLSQTALAVLLSMLCTAMLLLENLAFGAMYFGLGGLSRPIQSVHGYLSCNLPLSVGAYLLTVLGVRMLAAGLIAAVTALVCCIGKSNVGVYGGIGLLTGAALLLYQIPQTSPAALLHFWNPVTFIRTDEIFCGYTNVNLLGYPVSLKRSAVTLILLGLPVCSAIGAVIYAKIRPIQYRVLRIPLPHRKFRVHTAFFYAAHRSLIQQKSIWPAAVFLLAVWAAAASFVRPYSNNEILYENLCTELDCQSFEDAALYVAQQYVYFAEIQVQIDAEYAGGAPNPFRLQVLSGELTPKWAVQRVGRRLAEMHQNGVESGVFYDSGYVRLFALESPREHLADGVLALLYLTLMLAPLTAGDRMKRLLFTTKAGKRQYFASYGQYAAIQSIAAALLLTLPRLIRIFQHYGTHGLSAPIQAVCGLGGCALPITVIGGIVLMIVCRLLFLYLCSGVILAVSNRCHSKSAAVMICTAIFVLPVTIALIAVIWSIG